MTAPRRPMRSVPKLVERKQVCFRLDTESQEYLEAEALAQSAVPPYHDISVSDILRFAVREYREKHGDPLAPRAKPPCDVVEAPAGKYCTVCFSRSTAEGLEPLCRGSTR